MEARALLAGNWKMNPVSAGEAADLARGVIAAAQRHAEQVETVLCPPFPWLLGVQELIEQTPLRLGAQDCFWEQSGAYTGEVSPAMLAGWCRWVILGHSERRLNFGETDEQVARKVAAALAAGLMVILCVGEQEPEYLAGVTEAVVTRQVQAALAGLPSEVAERMVVAYEPVWAIGTGRSADPEHAFRTMRSIGRAAEEQLGPQAAQRLRLLYGGSVSADNVASYVGLPNCDGCLVGGASLRAQEFSRMIEVVAEIYGARPQGS